MQLWKGSTSCKFSGGRTHLTMGNELDSRLLPNRDAPSQGIRTFEPATSLEQSFKPCLRILSAAYESHGAEIDMKGKKFIQPPDQMPRIRKEKGHLEGGIQTYEQYILRGVRTFEHANKSGEKQYNIEKQIQQKVKILGLDQQRNNLGMASLGDKSYKYPEYQTNFYRDGGLIPGSTGLNRGKSAGENLLDPNRLKSVFTKPMWSVKVKMDEAEEDRKTVNYLDQWEQNLIKQAAKVAAQVIPAGKDAKKGAKK